MRKHSLLEINMGCNYTQNDLEFFQALDRYKRSNQRPHPTWSEVLNILLSLGYRKVAKKSRLPKPGTPFILPEEAFEPSIEAHEKEDRYVDGIPSFEIEEPREHKPPC